MRSGQHRLQVMMHATKDISVVTSSKYNFRWIACAVDKIYTLRLSQKISFSSCISDSNAMQITTTNELRLTPHPDKAERFRAGIQAISTSAEALLSDLRKNSASRSPLGLHLTGLLKNLRQQRMHSMDLAMGQPANAQFDAFISALGYLRGTVAQWLTVHATHPHAIEEEATDFEIQCFSTLGAGVMWLDSLQQASSGSTANNLAPSAMGHSELTDEQMLSFVFGMQAAQGEDITDQVQHTWNQFTTQQGIVA